MKFKNVRGLFLLVGLLGLMALACDFGEIGGGDGPPSNAVVVDVAANTSLEPWLTTAVTNFNDAEIQNSDEKPVYVNLISVESGQAVNDFAEGTAVAMWIPDEQVWVNVLADQGNGEFQGDCVSVAESPLVIGMWRTVAESLGYPGLPLGWLDVGSLAGDPSAWRYYSGGEYGDALRISHTHPGLSGTGTGTLLALVQAAQSKSEAVTTDDIQQPIVQASVGAFESAVTWFSTGTDLIGQTMASRGPEFLGAAVMYENTAVHYGNGEIIPIYPLEGTFMATHPACLNQSNDATTQEAAQIFRDYLVGDEAQTTAVTYALRSINPNVAVGPTINETSGVDLSQPEIIFNSPSVDTIYAVQDLWQEARKDVNLVMLLDTSGSMRGNKMENMREAALQFVEQMGDDDYISIIAFSTEPEMLVNHALVGESRSKVANAINSVQARGDTTLFDAIGDGATTLEATGSPDTANALVVLSDGEDTRSYRYSFNQELIDKVVGTGATVFTISYGSGADMSTMQGLATAANGNYYAGDEASIAAIYEEMSAAFGGSVGVGR